MQDFAGVDLGVAEVDDPFVPPAQSVPAWQRRSVVAGLFASGLTIGVLGWQVRVDNAVDIELVASGLGIQDQTEPDDSAVRHFGFNVYSAGRHNLLFGGVRCARDRGQYRPRSHDRRVHKSTITALRTSGSPTSGSPAGTSPTRAPSTTTIPAGHWAVMSLDLVVDCSVSAPELNVEVGGADGEAVVLSATLRAGRHDSSTRLCGTCCDAARRHPAVETVVARTGSAGGVVYVDIELVHGADSNLKVPARRGDRARVRVHRRLRIGSPN